mgnify:FL=1
MHRESNEAGGIRLRTTGLFHRLHIMSLLWLLVTDCEQRGCFHRLHFMSLLWLQVSACEQRGCLHLLHIMSLLWLQVCVCEHGVLLAAHRGADEAGGI